MRRAVLFCAALLLCVLTGCADRGTADQSGEAYVLYFQEADLSEVPGGDALRSETVYLEETGSPRETAEALMEQLLDGPADETLKSTIPQGTTLLSLELDGLRARVDLSFPYRTLSGVALTMADYAITLTLTQLPEISTVSITVRGQELAYRESQSFTARDVLFSSNEDVIGTLPVTLYFLNEDNVLTPEHRTLDLYEGDTQVGAVLQALEDGSEDRSLRTTLPEPLQVGTVWLEESVCYVNLSSATLLGVEDETELELAMQALVWSLCSLDTVEEVQFLVDGEFAANYGTIPVAEPYSR